ncbi:MAG: hypothetical protein J6U54_08030 [Clostridiales bacterium]|nr:hypothetical protein [Clostridiales bacterium]
MNRKEIKQEYFRWLCHFIDVRDYGKLLSFLFSVDFDYTLPMDGNRYEDGINLRYRFADEKKYHYRHISAWLDDVPCSMLEMMVALCLRIEEHITGDPEVGDRTTNWFKAMLKSSGLDEMDNDHFDQTVASKIVRDVIQRRYGRNGDGGLFRLRRNRRDLRHVEIWYQAMWYIDEVLNIK